GERAWEGPEAGPSVGHHAAEQGLAQGPRQLARDQRGGQREGVGVVVMAARRMVHQRLAPHAGTTLEQFQLPGELGMVEQGDVALGEEGLDLEVGEALVGRLGPTPPTALPRVLRRGGVRSPENFLAKSKEATTEESMISRRARCAGRIRKRPPA